MGFNSGFKGLKTVGTKGIALRTN